MLLAFFEEATTEETKRERRGRGRRKTRHSFACLVLKLQRLPLRAPRGLGCPTRPALLVGLDGEEVPDLVRVFFGFWYRGGALKKKRGLWPPSTFLSFRRGTQASGPHLVNHPPVARVVADPDGPLPLAQAHAVSHHGPVRLADPGEPSTQRDEERADGRRRRRSGHFRFPFFGVVDGACALVGTVQRPMSSSLRGRREDTRRERSARARARESNSEFLLGDFEGKKNGKSEKVCLRGGRDEKAETKKKTI
jgi:hypothetical protein